MDAAVQTEGPSILKTTLSWKEKREIEETATLFTTQKETAKRNHDKCNRFAALFRKTGSLTFFDCNSGFKHRKAKQTREGTVSAMALERERKKQKISNNSNT